MAITWSPTSLSTTDGGPRSAKAVCSTGTETFAAAITDGILLDKFVTTVGVHISADSGQTLSGAGTLLCYVYNPASTRWSRMPALDIPVTSAASGLRDVGFPALRLQNYLSDKVGLKDTPGQTRLAYVPDSVTLSGGGLTIYLDANCGVEQSGIPTSIAVTANVTSATHGDKTNNAAPPDGQMMGNLSALANAAVPTWTEGDLVLLSADLAGNQRVINPMQLPASLGQKAMAASLAVVLASNQSAVPTTLSGTVPLPTGAATDASLGTLHTDFGTLTGKFDSLSRDALKTDAGLVVRPLYPDASLSAFGEPLSAHKRPQVLIAFEYGINSYFTSVTTANGATVTQSGSAAVLTSSTATNGSAILESKGASHYDSGTGILSSFSMLFAAATAGAVQAFGLLDSQEGMGFGYNGVAFGVFTKTGGSYTWVAQTAWNGDKLDGTGPSGVTLNPQTMNLGRIQFGWHGAADVQFFIYVAGRWTLVHTIAISNSATVPLFQTPNLPLRAEVTKTSGATNLVIKTWSMGCYSEGETSVSQSSGAPVSVTSGTKSVSTEVAMVTLQNKTSVFSGKTNRVRTQVVGINVNSLGGQDMGIRVIMNTALGGAPSYTDFDANTSVSAFDTAGTTVTGGRVVWQGRVDANLSLDIDLENAGIWLNPGDTLTVAFTSGGGATNASASINAIERFQG